MPQENSKKTARVPGKPFPKGKTGNPNGRPKKLPEEFELIAACKNKTPAALAVLESLMLKSTKDATRLGAALAIIERAHGKPLQPVNAYVDVNASVSVTPERPKLTREQWLASLGK
jgi:hypothetical protein